MMNGPKPAPRSTTNLVLTAASGGPPIIKFRGSGRRAGELEWVDAEDSPVHILLCPRCNPLFTSLPLQDRFGRLMPEHTMTLSISS